MIGSAVSVPSRKPREPILSAGHQRWSPGAKEQTGRMARKGSTRPGARASGRYRRRMSGRCDGARGPNRSEPTNDPRRKQHTTRGGDHREGRTKEEAVGREKLDGRWRAERGCPPVPANRAGDIRQGPVHAKPNLSNFFAGVCKFCNCLADRELDSVPPVSQTGGERSPAYS